jgi:SAM-dependent methyltransferase
MKTHFDMTLTDLSPAMLEVSRELNPECEHVHGDMRTLRLERRFDAVFVQDAVMYMTSEDDLAATIATAAAHLEPGGVALFVPDDTAETYRPATSHGGDDEGIRGIRYLQWSHPASGSSFDITFVYVLRDGEAMRVEHEQHTFGIFPVDTWLRLIADAGLEAHRLPYVHSEFDDERHMFAGINPA